MERLRQLGDRLDVIETALSVALHEPEPEHRGRMLNALDLATAAARAEHQEVEETAQKKRSTLRLIHASPASAASAEHWTGRIPGRAAKSAG